MRNHRDRLLLGAEAAANLGLHPAALMADLQSTGAISILGALFGNRNNRFRRTELLILIRPLVINNASDAARVTDYWRTYLSGANGVYSNGAQPPNHLILGGQ